MTVRKTGVMAVFVAVGAAAAWLFVPSEPEGARDPEKVSRPSRKIAERPLRKAERRESRPQVAFEREATVSTEDKTREEMDRALKDENLGAAVKLAAQAVTSTNVEVRAEALDMLAWFGEKTLPELTGFLSDPDERVRHTALLHWKDALGEINNEKEKAAIIRMTMRAMNDPETLESVGSELVGIDERLAIETLSALINTGSGAQAGQARKTYEFITGEKYVSKAEALARLDGEETDDD